MRKSWTAGLDEKGSAEVQQEFNSAGALRAKLTEILEKNIVAQTKKGRSEEMYQSPNWALQQADINGYNRALEHVISLIK